MGSRQPGVHDDEGSMKASAATLHHRCVYNGSRLLLQGSNLLYEHTAAQVQQQLRRFEAHALQGCLSMPAGLELPQVVPLTSTYPSSRIVLF